MRNNVKMVFLLVILIGVLCGVSGVALAAPNTDALSEKEFQEIAENDEAYKNSLSKLLAHRMYCIGKTIDEIEELGLVDFSDDNPSEGDLSYFSSYDSDLLFNLDDSNVEGGEFWSFNNNDVLQSFSIIVTYPLSIFSDEFFKNTLIASTSDVFGEYKEAYDKYNDAHAYYWHCIATDYVVEEYYKTSNSSNKEGDTVTFFISFQTTRIRGFSEIDTNDYVSSYTYEQLARYPDDYFREKVKFSGKVLQTLETDERSYLLVAVDSNDNDVLFVSYKPSIIEGRLFTNDTITFYGDFVGIDTYDVIDDFGNGLPRVDADRIELK